MGVPSELDVETHHHRRRSGRECGARAWTIVERDAVVMVSALNARGEVDRMLVAHRCAAGHATLLAATSAHHAAGAAGYVETGVCILVVRVIGAVVPGAAGDSMGVAGALVSNRGDVRVWRQVSAQQRALLVASDIAERLGVGAPVARR